MVQHFQTLQNINSYEDFVKQYLDESLQAIPNLGQRTLYNNNNLSYSSFSFSDLSNNNSLTDEEQEYSFFELKRTSNDLLSIKIFNINTSKYTDFNYNSNSNNSNSLSKIINNLDKDKDNNLFNDIFVNYKVYDHKIFKSDNNKLTFMIKFGSKDMEIDEPIDFLYCQYENNLVKHILYVSECNYIPKTNEDSSNRFILYKIDLVENNIENNKYKLEIILFTEESIRQIVENYTELDIDKTVFQLVDLYNLDEEHINSVNKIFSLFDEYYVEYSNIEKIQNNDITHLSFINLLLLYKENQLDLPIYFDTFNDVITFDNNKNDITFNLNIKKFKEEQLITSPLNGYIENDYLDDIYYIMNITQSNYQNILEQYDKIQYNDKTILFVQIIKNLYYKLRNEYGLTNSIENDRILIPWKYKFTYICDNNDDLHIYFSNYINILSGDIYSHSKSKLNTNTIYYDNSNIINNISVWNFNFIYNDFYNIVDSININKIYTMPYINGLYNWVVNDVDTDISALNVINNNIKYIVIYVGDVAEPDSVNVLNATDNDVLEYFTFKTSDPINISDKYFNEYYGVSDIQFTTQIPKINDFNKNFFKNSVLYIITDTSHILEKEDTNYRKDYCLDYIYTLWKFENNEFVCITDFNNKDKYYDPQINNAFISYIYNQKNNLFTSIKIDKSNLVDQKNNVIPNKYIVLRNRVSNLYNKNLNLTDIANKYENDLNYTTEILSKYFDGNEDPEYDQMTKFINDLQNINLTNVLYPEYQINSVEVTSSEDIYRVIPITSIGTSQYMDIYIDGNKAISSNYITYETYNEYKLIIEKNLDKNIIIRNVTYVPYQYYLEYIPNDDIPTLDNKEILMRNINVINRLNILHFDKSNLSSEKSSVYNGYIGSKIVKNTDNIDLPNETLVIGTSETNINIGNDTLLSADQQQSFCKFKTLKTDGFEHLQFEADKDISVNKHIIDNIISNVKTTSFIPSGLVSNINGIMDPVEMIINNSILTADISQDNKIIFMRFVTDYNNAQYDLFDTIYINNVISSTFDIDIKNNQNVNIISENLIFDAQNNNEHHYFMIINSKRYKVNDDENVMVINKQLNVSISGDKIYIDFDDSKMNVPDTNNCYCTESYIISNIDRIFDSYRNGSYIQKLEMTNIV